MLLIIIQAVTRQGLGSIGEQYETSQIPWNCRWWLCHDCSVKSEN